MQSSDVDAVVDKFGPSDLSKLTSDFDSGARAANNATFLILHGSRDRLVSPSQTLILHNALIAAGGHSVRYVLDGAGHGDLAFLGDRVRTALVGQTNHGHHQALPHGVDRRPVIFIRSKTLGL